MKYNIFNGLIACGALAVLAGCSENSWNDEYLDDFKAPGVYTATETVDYTLSASDFKAIGDLSTALTQAEADGFTKTQLQNWAKLGYFTSDFPANKYLPIFLDSSSFPYFAANDGSAVTVSYQEEIENEVINAVYNAKVLTLSNLDYQAAWNDPDKFAYTFTPKVSASKSLPSILKNNYPDAKEGNYALVNYNYSETEPTFGTVSAVTPIDQVKVKSEYTIRGKVTAVCNQGYILTDDTGSLLVYYGSSFVAANYFIGMDVMVSGKGSQYNGGLQLSPTAETIYSSEKYTYPTPIVMDGAKMDALRDIIVNNSSKGTMAEYVEFTATVISTGNYTNFTVTGAETTGSAYQLTSDAQKLFTKGETVALKGYILSVNTDKTTKKPTYVNFVITQVGDKTTATMGNGKFTPNPGTDEILENALYTFDGTAWAVATTIDLLISPSDLEEMGISNNYISNADAAYNFPVFLKSKYPYAKIDDSMLVAYQSGAKYANAAQFNYNGSEWSKYDNLESKSGQYTKVNGSWIFNPNVTLVIPNVRQSEPGLTFYQIAVDWVKDNEGSGYIDRGNAEFYSGCSAYYCNINHDITQVEKYAGAMYTDLTPTVVIPLMRERFLNEVMPATLKGAYPNANLIDGYNDPIIYEIDYITYYGSTTFDGKTGNVNDTVKYEVTGPAEFKLVYSTWLGGEVTAPAE